VLLWRAIAPFYLFRAVYHFVLPGAMIAMALMVREWSAPRPALSARMGQLMPAAVPFLGGVLIPVLVFGVGFALAGALPALLHGVFVAPFRRLAFANMRPPAPYWALAATPLAVLLRPRPDPTARQWRRSAAALAVVLAGLLGYGYLESFPHRFVWQSLRGLIPVVSAVIALVIALPGLTSHWRAGAIPRFVLLGLVTAFASLIQFPFTSPVYFLYVAPLLLLALVALVRGMGRTPAPVAGVTLGFYALFAVLLVTPGAVEGMGFNTVRRHATTRLDLPRAGLRVKPDEAILYEALIPEVVMRAHGGAIWAGPDAPEVYFLGGFRNRTRAVFDFLGADGAAGVALLRNLDGVTAVVLNHTPLFSSPLPGGLLDSLRSRFPEGHEVGHFELRWRP
ncbi:MAG TPA: hypothetical protein VFU23_16230, partial [Gemmatimonadales bacterium]|nr:hypothetical protein [Gemmatimonadales bacterium]